MALLSVSEVADRLGIAVSTVYDLVRQHQIGHHRLGTGRGRILFSEQDLSAYLAACKVEAESRRPGFRFTHRRP
jgi:excisionase family DNA binding protein